MYFSPIHIHVYVWINTSVCRCVYMYTRHTHKISQYNVEQKYQIESDTDCVVLLYNF